MRKAVVALSIACASVLPALAHAQSEKFTGVWEGIEHQEGRQKPAALVLHPRGTTSVAGIFYFNGDSFGDIEDARLFGDSLTFHEGSLHFYARLVGLNQLSLRLIVRPGRIHDIVFTHTSSDTTQRPAAAGSGQAAAPVARDTAPDSVYRAHVRPASRVSSVDPSLRKGTLLLVGGGAGGADINARFIQLAGGPDARIVIIATAAINSADPAVIRETGERMARLVGAKNFVLLHTTSRREADSPEFIEPLRHATGVWITGGEASWLIDSYMGTRTESELIAVLDRGGVVAGSSAGALIWGSKVLLYRAHPGASMFAIQKPEDVVIGDVRETTIGLLRNVLVAPHFTEFQSQSSMERLIPANPGLLGIGIDEDTALEVHADVGRAFGHGAVTVFDGRHPGTKPLVLRNGARYDILRRVVL